MRTTFRTRIAVAGAGALALLATVAAPADAQTTTATFTLTGNGKSISAADDQATLNSGLLNIGAASVTGALPEMTVTDEQGVIGATWTVEVELTSQFETDDGGPHEVIPADKVSYASGVATMSPLLSATVTPTLVPESFTAEGDTINAVGATMLFGQTEVSWTPTVTVTIPEDVAAGTYEGVLTHSFA